MVQGTTSDAGKSILVAAICRILANHGYKVAPFKPQNMALNSAVTADGGEIGRAQAVQAMACGIKPTTDMNPVLLKPNSDTGAQVIVHGKAVANMDAMYYHNHKPELLNAVLKSHQRLVKEYNFVIVEGAGSPAEINLRDRDIANMGFAEAADCPVIIVADIDRGGVFAHLTGTLDCLSESEQKRVKGFVINRFRGDIALLKPGLDWLEEKTGKPVLGVIPYIENLHVEAEDAIHIKQQTDHENNLHVVVPVLTRISNHTDFDALALHPNVNLEFIKDAKRFKGADLIILPGTKNVRQDYQWLKQSGWTKHIEKHLRYGGKLMGICGGLQMLGHAIHDPDGIEGTAGSTQTFGYLDFETTLDKQKSLLNVKGKFYDSQQKSIHVKGYEIHAGISQGPDFDKGIINLGDHNDGIFNAEQSIFASYLHGIFDEPTMLDFLLKWAGLEQAEGFDYAQHQNQELNRLAQEVEKAIPLSEWLDALGETP
ncbi:cobyric acid synthase [Oceaniserpentilla sp. 4NH20-0058]|uniref:cobyric acid synthase n=1 Tax=Oceaniserpentilla sp. 4NH20-0058 TaxID=3127660 RepID=UPI0031021F60